MAYRTLFPVTTNPQLYGVKITTAADLCRNSGGMKGMKSEVNTKIKSLRGGSGSDNKGSYKVNGIQCYHSHIDGGHAVAWHYDSTTKPQYVIIEAFMEHKANKYFEMK